MVTRTLARLGVSDSFARFQSDLNRRYPGPPQTAAKTSDRSAAKSSVRTHVRKGGSRPAHRLDKLPPEVGALLIVVGVVGVLLPGPVGSPFLVAGGLAMWPSGFRKVEDLMQKVSPRLYAEGIRQLERYLADLERRYPGTMATAPPRSNPGDGPQPATGR